MTTLPADQTANFHKHDRAGRKQADYGRLRQQTQKGGRNCQIRMEPDEIEKIFGRYAVTTEPRLPVAASPLPKHHIRIYR